nr:MAG: RNA-dependent RNA polymerase [Permutotetraviridae sp.]
MSGGDLSCITTIIIQTMASNEQQQLMNSTSLREILQQQKREKEAGIEPSRPTSPDMDTEKHKLVTRLQRVPIPGTPATPKKMTQEHIKVFLKPLIDNSAIRPISPLMREKTDVRQVGKKDLMTKSYTTNVMLFTNYNRDGLCFKVFQEEQKSYSSVKNLREFTEAFEESVKTIGSAGTMTGVLTRLVQGMSATKTPTMSVEDCVRYARSITKYHPVEFDFRGQSAGEVAMSLNDAKILEFNLKASAGLAYGNMNVKDAFPAAVHNMETFTDAVSKGNVAFRDLRERRRGLFAVALKNKTDYYKVSDLEKKTRPYFVYNLHERVPYSCLQSQIKDVRFDEDSTCSSVIGFSWNEGGGDRLYEWCLAGHEGPPGFKSIFYADDQEWLIKLTNGKTYILTPDFSHMDLSLKHMWGKVAAQVWLPLFANKVDKMWATLLLMNCERAFNREVVVDGVLTYQFQDGLASGVPGTSKFDGVASAAVNGWVAEFFEQNITAIQTEDQLIKILVLLFQQVKDKFGLIFKEGSETLYEFLPDQAEYPFIFLGQKLVRVKAHRGQHYVPKPDLTRMIISATTFKKSYAKGIYKQRATMQKLRSIYAGGGYLYPEFADAAHRAFLRLQKQGVRVHEHEDDEDLDDDAPSMDEVEQSIFVKKVDWNPLGESFPSPEWAMNLFLPKDDQVPLVHGRTMTERTDDGEDFDDGSPPADTSFLADDAMQKLLAEILSPTNWGEDPIIPRTADVGVDLTKLPAPKTVSPQHQNALPPLTTAQKEKWEAEQEAARAIIREQRALRRGGGGALTKKTGKKKGKTHVYEDADDYDYSDDDNFEDATDVFDDHYDDDDGRYRNHREDDDGRDQYERELDRVMYGGEGSTVLGRRAVRRARQ